MKLIRPIQNQRGFTLVQAIFIVVVLALLGVAMLRLSGVQSSTSVFALQGARAYQAARSGLDWAASRAQPSAGANCAASSTMTIDIFTVTVTCTAQTFTEGIAAAYPVYRFTSTARYSTFGSADFVQRRLEAKVGYP
jgi:MSHA biogenesis protein MshP